MANPETATLGNLLEYGNFRQAVYEAGDLGHVDKTRSHDLPPETSLVLM